MSGSIRELAPSKRDGAQRWELRVFAGRDPSKAVRDTETGAVVKQGSAIHVSRVFRGGKREAKKALAALVTEVADSVVDPTVGRTATLGKLLTEWLANLERLGRARSTLETYRIHVERHLRPGLGSVRLDKLTAHDVDRYLASLESKGLSPGTIKLNHATLSAGLTQAVDWGWIKSNPAKRARLKATPTKQSNVLTVDQLRALYEAAAADDPDMAVVIALAALTGCRRGELCGLQWNDLDEERAALRVERAWVPSQGGQHLTSTKSGKGREVFIGAEGVDLLRRYKDALRERCKAEPDGWLLSYDGGTTPLRAKSLSEYFSRLARRAGVPASLHSLRHWKASELVHQGIDLPTAAAQLGHTTGVMAEVYLHSTDERAAAAGELIAGVVRRAMLPTRSSDPLRGVETTSL